MTERTSIVFDDLKADPLGVYRRALEFLQVDYDGQTHFERKYHSRMYRYRWLQQLFYIPVVRAGKVIDTAHRSVSNYNKDGSRRRSLISRAGCVEYDRRATGAFDTADGCDRAGDAAT